MAARCFALLFNCPACGRHFKTAERVPACPDCGADLHCDKWAIPGYSYCENHGGPAPARNFYGKGRGIVTGENGRFELTKLAAKHQELSKDGRFLSNRASIEVLTERVRELIQRAEENYSPTRMITLQKLWEELKAAERSQNGLEKIKITTEIDAEFEAAYHDYMAWKQAAEFMDLTSKMVEREAKIAKDLHAILTADDAYKLTAKLLGVIVDTVRQQVEVPDNVKAQILKRLEYEFTRIIGEGSGQEPGGGGGEVIDA